MAHTLNVLAFSGSLRTNSFNKKLVVQACDFLKEQNCVINYLDLRSLNLPLYDGDLEDKEGMPEGAQKLVAAILNADALVIGNPEYNSAISGSLKNAIDWASRADKNPFAGKIVLLLGTSTGWFGAVRASMMTRNILNHLKAIVIPTAVTVPLAEKAFDQNGLKDPQQTKLLQDACLELVRFTAVHKAAARSS